jgi:hypothetical protein
MRNLALFFCGLSLIWVASSCISFKVEPLPDPGRIVREVTLCKEIDESQELLEPGEAVTEFRVGKDSVFCFLHLQDVAQQVELKWKWYSPDDKLFKTSDEATINQDEIYLEAVTAYDMISPESLADHHGRWSVAVFVNDVLLTRLIFTVIPDARLNNSNSKTGLTFQLAGLFLYQSKCFCPVIKD